MFRPGANVWEIFISIVGRLIAKFGKLVKFACSLSLVNFGAKGTNLCSFRIVDLIAKIWIEFFYADKEFHSSFHKTTF